MVRIDVWKCYKIEIFSNKFLSKMGVRWGTHCSLDVKEITSPLKGLSSK